MSLFITFEGGEGCGKSTQARALHRRLKELAIPVVLTQEPGGTPLGNRIRHWLKWGRGEALAPETELLLFNASRAQLVASVIRPALLAGTVVVCDRFTDSTLAYQSYGRGLPLEMVEDMNEVATGGLRPDLTILLDIPVEAGFQRKKAKPDRFEQESLAFHQRVRDGYRRLAASDPDRWLVIDATLPRRQIGQVIWQRFNRMLTEVE